LLRMASVSDDSKCLATLLSAVGTPKQGSYAAWQLAALAGLLDAIEKRKTSLVRLSEGRPQLTKAIRELDGLFAFARTRLSDGQADLNDRLLAVRLVGRGSDRQSEDVQMLAQFLAPQNPDALQAAAVEALGSLSNPNVPQVFLRGWKGYGPSRRSQVLDALLRRDDGARTLLAAIDKKEVSAFDIDAARRQRLLQHRDRGVRQQAERHFGDAINSDRRKLVREYQPALRLVGDSKRGSAIFGKHCAVCHKLGDVGHTVGPDLASVGDKSAQGLLVAILDPNRAVEARYVNYTALTKSGQVFSGVLTAETSTSITLSAQEGAQHQILRSDLEELVTSGKSAMPEGLEKEVGHQEMADLIAFIGSTAPPPKRKEFAGNQPALVVAAADGSLLLTAQSCEIYGRTLELEKKHGNLGCWYSEDDRAVWTVEVRRAGKYAVWLDWACVESSAGKRYVLEAGPNQLNGRVQSTGEWDSYKQAKVGEILLAAGQQRITFRNVGHIASPLIDLNSIKLVPDFSSPPQLPASESR